MQILIIGAATDGPADVAFKPKNEKELKALFGGGYVERFTLTPTTSSVALAYSPWGFPENRVDNLKNYLFSPSSSGNIYSFGTLGSSGVTYLLDVIYTPYLGKNDLLLSAKTFLQRTGNMPYVGRAGGTYSSLEVSNWKFESAKKGARYNNIDIAWDGTTLVVSGFTPNYPSISYTPTDISELADSVNSNAKSGVSPVYITKYASSLNTGTYSMTGGTDGTLSESDFSNFLERCDISPEVSHVIVLAELTSGMITAVNDYFRSSSIQPRLFIFAGPSWTNPTSSWVTVQSTGIPQRHNMVSAILGDVTLDIDGFVTTRYAVDLAGSSLFKTNAYNMTNMPLEVLGFTPILSENELNSVIDAGFVPLSRYIGNDISTYQGSTTRRDKSFLYSSKLAEIYAIANSYCFQFLGSPFLDGEYQTIAKGLRERLESINYLTIEDVRVYTKGGAMFVNIDAFLPEEILSISFRIANR